MDPLRRVDVWRVFEQHVARIDPDKPCERRL